MFFVCTAWAGGHRKVSDVGPGALYVSAGSARISFGTNPDGTLKGVLSGSIPVFANQLESVLYSSQRMGYLGNSRAKAPLVSNAATITGLANNDDGTYYAKFTNGKLYKVDVESMTVTTANPMFYELNKAQMIYGELKETIMAIALASDNTVTITGQFGCDVPVGVRDLATATGLLAVEFVANDGNVYIGEVSKDSLNNLSFVITGIALVKPGQYDNKRMTGKLFAVMTDGSRHQFEFNPQANGATYVWYASGTWSPTSNLWMEYSAPNDSVIINLWEAYVPPAPPVM